MNVRQSPCFFMVYLTPLPVSYLSKHSIFLMLISNQVTRHVCHQGIHIELQLFRCNYLPLQLSTPLQFFRVTKVESVLVGKSEKGDMCLHCCVVKTACERQVERNVSSVFCTWFESISLSFHFQLSFQAYVFAALLLVENRLVNFSLRGMSVWAASSHGKMGTRESVSRQVC